MEGTLDPEGALFINWAQISLEQVSGEKSRDFLFIDFCLQDFGPPKKTCGNPGLHENIHMGEKYCTICIDIRLRNSEWLIYGGSV